MIKRITIVSFFLAFAIAYIFLSKEVVMADTEQEISAGYNSMGNEVFVTFKLLDVLDIAAEEVSVEQVSEFWLNNCIWSRAVISAKAGLKKNNSSSDKLFIKGKWLWLGQPVSHTSVMLLDYNRMQIKCIDKDY